MKRDFAGERLSRERARYFVLEEIRTLLGDLDPRESLEIRTRLNAEIHRETSLLAEARKETERLFRPALQGSHAKIF